jgi:uncharacterized protein with HEPN domain
VDAWIGEKALNALTTQLSSELKERFADVMWQQPTRLRNRIVHGYWSIDMEILHTTATEHLPAFADDLRNTTNLRSLPRRSLSLLSWLATQIMAGMLATSNHNM